MVLMTMIARLVDALPLAASVHDDTHTNNGQSLVDYQNQAKLLFRKMNAGSPVRGSLETGPYLFHYLIDRDVCYLTMCDKAFSKRTAFSYLEDLSQEFYSEYGSRIHTVARPYSFIEFDKTIQKTKKQYLDTRLANKTNNKGNLNRLNTELQEVQKIMVQNIDDVLQRGDALQSLNDRAQNLNLISDKYKKKTRMLNLQSTYAKIGGIILLIVILLLVVKYYLF